MSELSNDYVLWIPDSGHPLSGISPLQCGDVTGIEDVLNGTVSSSSALNFGTNKAVEIKRFREYSQSQLEIFVPEAIAQDFRAMRDQCCMIGVQRRLMRDGALCKAHHYGYASIDSFQINDAVLRGLGNAPTAFPTQTIPVIFGLYQLYDGNGPIIHQEPGWNPVSVTFCDLPNCSACCNGSAGCMIAYAVLEDEMNETKVVKITINSQNSTSSEEFLFAPIAPSRETAVHCFEGKLFIGIDSGFGNLAIVPDPSDPDPVNTIFGSIGTSGSDVLKIRHSGHLLYAAWNNSGEYGVDISISAGQAPGADAWQTIFSEDTPGSIIDIAVAGSAIAIITSDNRLLMNVESGFGDFDEIELPSGIGDMGAVSLAIPDFQNPDCPLIYIVDESSKIYGSVFNGSWELLLKDEVLCNELTPVQLETSIDGFGVWYSRAITGIGQVVTLKNVGRGTDCEWMRSDFRKTFELGACEQQYPVVSCLPGFLANTLELEIAQKVPNGSATICFADGTNLPANVGNSTNPNFFIVQVFTDEVVSCAMRGGVISLNCVSDINYPCFSWQTSVLAMCPFDANKALLVVGTSCKPEGASELEFLVKGFDTEGNPTELVTFKAEECIPDLDCD